MSDLKIKILPEIKDKLIIYIGKKVQEENVLINLLSSSESYSKEDFETILQWLAAKPWQEVATIIEAIRVTSTDANDSLISDREDLIENE